LLSDSTLASGERLTLGYLFARTEEDLTFRYRTANGRVVEADVQYAPGMAGDFDGDGDVSGSDLLAWQRHYETALGPADLAAWRLNFGNGAAATAAPELASARLATVAAGLVLMFRAERRGAERRRSPDGDC
ncbi:MAG: hypothetical protein IT424_13490, partial [Pirellulales bacterium]|nr:hypothetical protein [Pirellulales bacterium]